MKKAAKFLEDKGLIIAPCTGMTIKNENGIFSMTKLLDEYANQSNWISVNDKLPTPNDDEYLVCVKNKNKDKGIFIQDVKSYSSDGYFVGGNPDVYEDVTHWQPLPTPPHS